LRALKEYIGKQVKKVKNKTMEYKQETMQINCFLVFSLKVITVYYLFIKDTLYIELRLNGLHFKVFIVFISLLIII
jgi:hypothetical protein